MWLVYYVGMYLLVLGIRISSLWNYKSSQWIAGRKNWRDQLQKKIPSKSGPRIWFHVSSLGEFEQSRSVIEKLKIVRPDINIILSFFSASGYNLRRDYKYATVIYLPPDLPGNADFFLSTIKPDMAVFVKYDLWPGYLNALADLKIPSILISANWSPVGSTNSWSFPLTRKLLKGFKRIFFQSNEHLDYFSGKGFQNIVVAGDTRIDRSILLPAEVNDRLPKEVLINGTFDLVAGSTWPPDEELIIDAIEKLKLKTIIAPHDVTPMNIERLTKKFKFPYQLLSQMKDQPLQVDVLVIDSIGILSALYSVGNIAYVGGGFGKGIHNSLEPAAHSKPVMFGPKYHKFPEAVDMIAHQGAWSISDKTEFRKILEELRKPGKADEAGRKNSDYLRKKAGATDIVTNYILESIPYKQKE